MTELRKGIPALAMPVNIILLLWMVAGWGFFVPVGLGSLFNILASPLLLICLVITGRMMRRPPGRVLTVGQVWAQLLLWLAMFGYGLTCSGRAGDGSTRSVLMKLVGAAAVRPGEATAMSNVNELLGAVFVIGGIASWCVLFSKLSRSVAPAQPPQQPYPYPGYPGPGQVNGHDRPY